MSYTSYYDDFTGVTHYENFFVIKIEELEPPKNNTIDTQCFILYDKEDDKFYVYGSRKCAQYPNMPVYQKSFSYINDVFTFLKVVMNLDFHAVNLIVYHIAYATSDADFDTLLELCGLGAQNEITGYDNIKIKHLNQFAKYFSSIIEF